ncbi:MAG: GNAT family N-acetyltransferase [Acidimicrobiales bacterium]
MSAIRLLLAADVDAAATTLATAFADDPMITWVSGEPDRGRRVATACDGFFRPALEVARHRGHTYVTSGGAAVWVPPDVALFTDADGPTFGASLVEHLGAEAAGRLGMLGELVRAHHPHDRPHFYLFLLGTAVQGTGLGGRLLTPVLDRCDADGVGAYLESSNPRNVAFYERHGFRVRWEARPVDDGPLMHGMWRDPAG